MLLLLLCVTFVAAENIKCNLFGTYSHDYFDNKYGNMTKCCEVSAPTEILYDDTTFLDVQETAVDGLYIKNSGGIHYLPVRIYKSYPNIIGIYAGKNKEIKEISKKNFQKLLKLEYLFLNNNNIQKIKSDTFEGLIKLKVVNLGMLIS